MAFDVFAYIERLRVAETADAKFQVFSEAASAMGFEQAFYGFSVLSEDAQISDNAAIYSNFVPDFLTTYEDENLSDHDISVRHCTTSDLPAPWFDPGVLDGLSKEELKVEHVAMDFGFKAGMTIPTREGRDGIFGGVSVATRDASKQSFEESLAAFGAHLQLLALCLHADVQQLLNPVCNEDTLTPREREVLMWAAIGQSSKQTARRLGITFRTVEWHLESARRKLSANNKVHAVSKAIARGLIPY